MCPVRKGTTKGVSKGRYDEGKSELAWETKGRGKQGKGKGKERKRLRIDVLLPSRWSFTIESSRVIADSGLYPIGTRKLAISRTDHEKDTVSSTARVWQLRYEKEHRKEEVRKDEIIRRHMRLYPWSQPSNPWNTTGQTNPWNRSSNPSQQSSDPVWQRNLKRRTDAPMDLDLEMPNTTTRLASTS